MRFWEAVKVALGMKNQGVPPTGLILKKIGIDGGPVKVEWEVATDITNDTVFIDRVVTELFRAPRVMSFPFEKETVRGSLESITKIHDALDGFINRFDESVAQKDKLYASLLIDWRLACRRAMQQLEDAQRNEQEDRDAHKSWELGEASDIRRADEGLPKILFEFRQKSYPAVSAFIDLLPAENDTRKEAETMLLDARKLLLNYKQLTGDPISALEWDVDM